MKHVSPRHGIVAALVAAVFSAGAAAQTSGTAPTTTPGATAGKPAPDKARTADARSDKLASGDRDFVTKAAVGGMAEVQLGELAQKNAASDDVKQFAARMVEDHGKANAELEQLAGAKGVQLPTSLDRKHTRDMERLQKLAGAEFDRAYMKHMLDDHKKDVGAFQKQAKSGRDEEIKRFAAKTLPTLQEHLKQAQTVSDKVSGATTARGAKTTPKPAT